MALQKTSAFVIKNMDWSDTSKITTLFTREFGKMNVIAKGARRASSRYRGLLETLNLVEVFIYLSPRRELQTLGDITLEKSYDAIRGNIVKTGYALSVLELVNSFFGTNNPDSIFFDFIDRLFSSLEITEREEEVFWYFLLKFASYLGFKPEFLSCRKCGKKVTGEIQNFSLQEGSVVCDPCLHPDGNHLKISKPDADYLFRVQSTNYNDLASLGEIKDRKLNFTDFLVHYIQYHTGQKIELNGLKLIRD
jgi:DNA repair protein RecO (recombination protein O)